MQGEVVVVYVQPNNPFIMHYNSDNGRTKLSHSLANLKLT